MKQGNIEIAFCSVRSTRNKWYLLAIALLLGSLIPAHADDISWRALNGGNWGDILNWNLGRVPGAGDIAYIDISNVPNRILTIIIPSVNAIQCDKIVIENTAGGAARTLSLQFFDTDLIDGAIDCPAVFDTSNNSNTQLQILSKALSLSSVTSDSDPAQNNYSESLLVRCNQLTGAYVTIGGDIILNGQISFVNFANFIQLKLNDKDPTTQDVYTIHSDRAQNSIDIVGEFCGSGGTTDDRDLLKLEAPAGDITIRGAYTDAPAVDFELEFTTPTLNLELPTIGNNANQFILECPALTVKHPVDGNVATIAPNNAYSNYTITTNVGGINFATASLGGLVEYNLNSRTDISIYRIVGPYLVAATADQGITIDGNISLTGRFKISGGDVEIKDNITANLITNNNIDHDDYSSSISGDNITIRGEIRATDGTPNTQQNPHNLSISANANGSVTCEEDIDVDGKVSLSATDGTINAEGSIISTQSTVIDAISILAKTVTLGDDTTNTEFKSTVGGIAITTTGPTTIFPTLHTKKNLVINSTGSVSIKSPLHIEGNTTISTQTLNIGGNINFLDTDGDDITNFSGGSVTIEATNSIVQEINVKIASTEDIVLQVDDSVGTSLILIQGEIASLHNGSGGSITIKDAHNIRCTQTSMFRSDGGVTITTRNGINNTWENFAFEGHISSVGSVTLASRSLLRSSTTASITSSGKIKLTAGHLDQTGRVTTGGSVWIDGTIISTNTTGGDNILISGNSISCLVDASLTTEESDSSISIAGVPGAANASPEVDIECTIESGGNVRIEAKDGGKVTLQNTIAADNDVLLAATQDVEIMTQSNITADGKVKINSSTGRLNIASAITSGATPQTPEWGIELTGRRVTLGVMSPLETTGANAGIRLGAAQTITCPSRITSTGAITIETISLTGMITLSQPISANLDVNVTANAQISVDSSITSDGKIDINSTNGTVQIGGSVTSAVAPQTPEWGIEITGTTVTLQLRSPLETTGDNAGIRLRAVHSIVPTSGITSRGAITLETTGPTGMITSTQPISANLDVIVTATRDIRLNDITSNGKISINSTSGSVNLLDAVTSAVTPQTPEWGIEITGNTVTLATTSSLTTTGNNAGIRLRATETITCSSVITSQGILTIEANDRNGAISLEEAVSANLDVFVTATNDISVSNTITSNGKISINSTSGPVTLQDAVTSAVTPQAPEWGIEITGNTVTLEVTPTTEASLTTTENNAGIRLRATETITCSSVITSQGALTIEANDPNGAISLEEAVSANLDVIVTATNDISASNTITSNGKISINSTSGPVTLQDAVTSAATPQAPEWGIEITGNTVTLAATSSLTTTENNAGIRLDATETITCPSVITSQGALTIEANDPNGAISLANDVSANLDVIVTATNDISASNTITSNGKISINSTSGSVTLQDAVTSAVTPQAPEWGIEITGNTVTLATTSSLTTTGNNAGIRLDATETITCPSVITSQGALTIEANDPNGAISLEEAVSANLDVIVTATNDISVSNTITSNGKISINSTSGSVTLLDAVTSAVTPQVPEWGIEITGSIVTLEVTSPIETTGNNAGIRLRATETITCSSVITSQGALTIEANAPNGAISLANDVSANLDVIVTATRDIGLNDITSNGKINITCPNGSVRLLAVITSNEAPLTPESSITIGGGEIAMANMAQLRTTSRDAGITVAASTSIISPVQANITSAGIITLECSQDQNGITVGGEMEILGPVTSSYVPQGGINPWGINISAAIINCGALTTSGEGAGIQIQNLPQATQQIYDPAIGPPPPAVTLHSPISSKGNINIVATEGTGAVVISETVSHEGTAGTNNDSLSIKARTRIDLRKAVTSTVGSTTIALTTQRDAQARPHEGTIALGANINSRGNLSIELEGGGTASLVLLIQEDATLESDGSITISDTSIESPDKTLTLTAGTSIEIGAVGSDNGGFPELIVTACRALILNGDITLNVAGLDLRNVSDDITQAKDITITTPDMGILLPAARYAGGNFQLTMNTGTGGILAPGEIGVGVFSATCGSLSQLGTDLSGTPLNGRLTNSTTTIDASGDVTITTISSSTSIAIDTERSVIPVQLQNDTAKHINSPSVMITSATGIGVDRPVRIDTERLVVENNTSGDVTFIASGDTIELNGVTCSGAGLFEIAGELDINVTAPINIESGSISLTASGENPDGSRHNIVIDSTVSTPSTSAIVFDCSGNITLRASLTTGSTNSDGIKLTAGGKITGNGTQVLESPGGARLYTGRGIGTVASPLNTSIGAVNITNSDSGDICLTNSKDLIIENLLDGSSGDTSIIRIEAVDGNLNKDIEVRGDITSLGEIPVTVKGELITFMGNRTASTEGGNVTLDGEVLVDVSLSLATGIDLVGDIVTTGSVNARTGVNSTLTINAGNGDVEFQQSIGDTNRLNQVLIGSANEVVLPTVKSSQLTSVTSEGNTTLLGTEYSVVAQTGEQRFNSTDSYVLLASTSDVTLSSTTTTFSSIYFDLPNGSTITQEGNLNVLADMVLYRGTLDLSDTTVEAENLILFGRDYDPDDPDRPASTTEFALPKTLSYYPDGGTYDETVAVFSTAPDGVVADLSGADFSIAENFYTNGVNMNGAATWSLTVPGDYTAPPSVGQPWGFPYAVAFNMAVSNSNAGGGGWISASATITIDGDDFHNNGVTDGGGNTNWQFYLPTIASAETVSDRCVAITFSDGNGTTMPLENSNNELSSAVASGGFRYNNGNASFSEIYINPEMTTSTDGQGDIATIYLKTEDAETWNTDATGASVGNQNSSDSNDNHRSSTVDITIAKGVVFASQGKTMNRAYGENNIDSYTATTDGAPPVLVEIIAGREDHEEGSPNNYDGHNYFNLRYSEQVKVGAANKNQLAVGVDVGNLRTSEVFASNGGNLVSAGGDSVDVAGLFSYPGTLNWGSRDRLVPHSIRRHSEIEGGNTHGIRLYIAGFRDATTNYQWPGYIIEATSPVGVTASRQATPEVYDLEDNQQTEISESLEITAKDTGWDVDPPAFSVESTLASYYEVVTLDTKDNNNIIDALDIHIQDNSSDNDTWNSFDFFTEDWTPHDLNHGIRDASIASLSAFRINIIGNDPIALPQPSSFSTNVDNPLFNVIEMVDDSFFRITLGEKQDYTMRSDMHFSYNSDLGLVTDLAGNLLPSTNEDITYNCVERNAPEIGVTLTVVDKQKIYVKFNEPVYGSGDSVTPSSNFRFPAPRDFSVDGTTPDRIELLTTDRYYGTEDLFLIMPSNLSMDDILNKKAGYTASNASNPTIIQETNIYDRRYNYSKIDETHRLSDLGLGVIEPVWAISGNPSERTDIHMNNAIREFISFPPAAGLSFGDIRFEISIVPEAYKDDGDILLYYDFVPTPQSIREPKIWLPEELKYLATEVNGDAPSTSPYRTEGAIRDFHIPESAEDNEFASRLEMVVKLGNGLYCTAVSDADDPRSILPWSVSLSQPFFQSSNVTLIGNVVNPLEGDEATLMYGIEKSGRVTIQVFNLAGDLVKVLHRGNQDAGEYSLNWDGRNNSNSIVARGVYLVRVVGPGVDEYRKVLIVK